VHAAAPINTIEGVAETDEIADLQRAFVARTALQCGYCTPGMLLTAQELLARGGVPTPEQTHLKGIKSAPQHPLAIERAYWQGGRLRRCRPHPPGGGRRLRAGRGQLRRVTRGGGPGLKKYMWIEAIPPVDLRSHCELTIGGRNELFWTEKFIVPPLNSMRVPVRRSNGYHGSKFVR
jgi:[2Fe-2S] binding domain